MQPTILINPASEPGQKQSFALFALGFRPFFLLAGIAGILLVGTWIALLRGYAVRSGYFDPVGWHRHEMLYGYTIAVVAGFLLTAVQNWTKMRTLHGKPLAALAALWLAGRVMIAIPDLFPNGLIAVVDSAFIPALGVALAGPLVRNGARKQYVFLLLLGLLALANILIHLEVLHYTTGTERLGTSLAINLVVLLIIIMGGRVIPFFTERALPGVSLRSWPLIERLAVSSVVVLVVVDLFVPGGWFVALILVVACISNAIRLLGWQSWQTAAVPLLWVLHLGYAWIVIGFGFQAMGTWLPEANFVALHALMVGGIGGMTLGMMARVAVGHTGRRMEVPAMVTLAFGLINLSAVLRVIVPIFIPSGYSYFVMVSGTLWVMAFVLFVIRYAPILIKSRVDGREG